VARKEIENVAEREITSLQLQLEPTFGWGNIRRLWIHEKKTGDEHHFSFETFPIVSVFFGSKINPQIIYAFFPELPKGIYKINCLKKTSKKSFHFQCGGGLVFC